MVKVRRSERMKSKQLLNFLTWNVPINYLEGKKVVDWRDSEISMKNELDSLNKHNICEIVDMQERK